MFSLVMALACTPGDGPGPGERFGDDAAWGLTFGGPETDEAWGISAAPDGSGDVLVGLHMADPVLTDAFLVRLSAQGVLDWQAQWGGAWSEQVFMVEPWQDRVYVSGLSFHGGGLTDADAMVAALDLVDGALRWDWTWDGGTGWDEVDGLGVGPGGEVYLSGWTTGEATGNDILLGKLSPEGEETWRRSWGTAGWDEANGHLVLTEDQLIVGGLTEGLTALVGGDMTIAAFSLEDGAEAWSESWGEAAAVEDALGLCSDGTRLYAVGYAPNPDGVMDLTVWATDMDGAQGWTWQWGASEWAGGRAIAIDPADGSIVIAGNTTDLHDGADRREDIVLARLDPATGALLQEARWGGDGSDLVHDLAIDTEGLWLVGESDSLGAGKLDALLLRVGGSEWELPPAP